MPSDEPGSVGHILLFALDGWGHLRPLSVLATVLVKTRPIHVTFFTSTAFIDKVEAELTRVLKDDDPEGLLRSLIRVVAISEPMNMQTEGFNRINNAFVEYYKKIIHDEPLFCLRDGKMHTPLPKPKVVLVDFFCLVPLKAIHQLSPLNPAKVFIWYSAGTSFIFHPFGPEKYGRKDLRPLVHEEVKRSGRDIIEVADEIMMSTEGIVVDVPGLPEMYDYEYYPQQRRYKTLFGYLRTHVYETMRSCDGIVLASSEALEPEATAALRDWFNEDSRKVIPVGPLLPSKTFNLFNEGSHPDMARKVQEFLAKILEERGPKSVLYIAFGSLHWPKPEQLAAFLEGIMESNVPFVLASGASHASLPDEVQERLNSHPIALVASWAPQQAILAHPATGWFLSHCGIGSVMEGINAGVPFICWPFSSDQPVLAARLSHKLDVAYELEEIRTGDGLKPIHRTGMAPRGTPDAIREEIRRVLKDAFECEGGQKKRENMKGLREKLLNNWKDGGRSKMSIEQIISLI